MFATDISDPAIDKARAGGRILYINHALPGIIRGQKADSSIYDFAVPAVHPQMRECFQQVWKTGEPGRFDALGVGIHAQRWFDHRVGPVRRDGQTIALSVVLTDVTERRLPVSPAG